MNSAGLIEGWLAEDARCAGRSAVEWTLRQRGFGHPSRSQRARPAGSTGSFGQVSSCYGSIRGPHWEGVDGGGILYELTREDGFFPRGNEMISCLQVYLGRCRDAYKCIRTDFPQFLREVDELPSLHPHYANTESMNHAEPSSQGMAVTPPARSAGARRSSSNASSTASATINANACTTPTRASRRLQVLHEVRLVLGVVGLSPPQTWGVDLR